MRPNRYLVFAVVAPALLMSSIDSTIVAVGLETMIGSFKTSLAVAAWSLTGYQLTQTIVMPMAGKLSDEVGRKQVFLISLVLFTAGSIGAGLAPTVYLHIMFRVIQAVGGGAFMPSATGVVSDAFDEDDRRTALGLFGSIFPLGGIVGPNIGGLIIDHTSWHWLFFVNVPIGILLLVGGLIVLPNMKNAERTKHRIDTTGAGLFGGAMFAILYGMTHFANHPDDFGSPVPWTFLALGAIMLAAFIRHEQRAAEPLLDMELVTRKAFVAANAFNLLYGASIFGVFSLTPYYAEVVYKMSPSEAGGLLTPRSVAMVAASMFSSFFLIRSGYRKPMIAGAAIAACCLLLLSRGFHDLVLFGQELPDFWVLGFALLLGGLGMGISNPASGNAALDLIPEKMAAAAGMRGMFRNTGGVLGTAGMTIALGQFTDKAQGFKDIFLFLAFAHLILIPITLMIPDSARDRRIERVREAESAGEPVAVGGGGS